MHVHPGVPMDPLVLRDCLRPYTATTLLGFTHYNNDLDFARALDLGTTTDVRVESPDHGFSVVAGLDCLVCSSLHATLMAYLQGKPFLSIAYAEKVRSFLLERGLGHRLVERPEHFEEKRHLLDRNTVDWGDRLARDQESAERLWSEILGCCEDALRNRPSKDVPVRSFDGAVSSHRWMIKGHAEYSERVTDRLRQRLVEVEWKKLLASKDRAFLRAEAEVAAQGQINDGLRNELDETHRALASLPFFGLAEKPVESLQLLAYSLNFPDVMRSFPIETEAASLLLEGAPWCSQRGSSAEAESAYAEVLRVFDERYETMISRLLLRHYSETFSAFDEPQDRVVVDLEEPVLGDGWHEPELDSRGLPFRWTGPSAVTTVDLPLRTDRDYLIEFRVVFALSRDLIDGVQLSVNGKGLETSVEDHLDGGDRCRALVPSSVLRRNEFRFTRLILELPGTLVPCEVNSELEDDRRLGLAIAEFSAVAMPLKESGDQPTESDLEAPVADDPVVPQK